MIAKNHEEIFRTVYPDLIAALERAGMGGGAHPYTLYLGNWMADFSQLYSPDLPNMLIDLLDLPDKMRTLAADGLAFLDAQQKALAGIVAAAAAKALLDKPALADTAAKVKASPYRKDELLQSYADYLRASPSPLVTPQPQTPSFILPKSAEFVQKKQRPSKTNNKIAPTQLSTLRDIGRRLAKRARSRGRPQPDANELADVLVQFMIEPLLEDLRNFLKAVASAPDSVDEAYNLLLEFLEEVGFVDKFNGGAALAIWLIGLFKFCDPANAQPGDAPGTGPYVPVPTGAAIGAPTSVPTFLIIPLAFVAPPPTAALRVNEHIPPNVYSELFAKYFGFYKPYEHLDRFMDAARVAELTGGGQGPRTLDQKRAFRHYRKDHYPLVVTPIDSLKGSGPDLDSTLWNNLQIAYGRLLALRETSPDKLSIDERLLLLGRSFHAFEDYFAHTNFVDRLIYSMQLEHQFKTHAFELKKILLSVASETAFNRLKADEALFRNVDCADKKVREIIEAGATECVKSGFYDTPDTIHSLVHLLEGMVRTALDMEDEERDARFDLYDALEKYALHKLEAIEKDLPTGSDLTILLTMKPEDVFLDEKSFAKIADGNMLLKSMGGNADWIRRLVNVTFWLILVFTTARNAKNAYVAIRTALTVFITLMRIIKALYFTPNVVLRYLRIALSTLPAPIRDELIALAVEIFKEACRVLASSVFEWIDAKLESKVRYGSHSLMAKDEAWHQDRLYALAEKFGILIDKVALEFAFPEPPPPTVPNAPPPPTPPKPREVLERLLDGIAYNPLSLEREALICVSHGVLTRYTLDKPEQLDLYLKGSVKALVAHEGEFAGLPGFALPLLAMKTEARWATAMRAMVSLNRDSITLILGQDLLYLSDATFKLLKPADKVDLIVWKPAQTPALKAVEITVKPWTAYFADAFLSGKPIDWNAFDLASLTGAPSSGKRGLPDDFRILADRLVRDYREIWQKTLVIPGALDDAGWAVRHKGNLIDGWL